MMEFFIVFVLVFITLLTGCIIGYRACESDVRRTNELRRRYRDSR